MSLDMIEQTALDDLVKHIGASQVPGVKVWLTLWQVARR